MTYEILETNNKGYFLLKDSNGHECILDLCPKAYELCDDGLNVHRVAKLGNVDGYAVLKRLSN